MVSQIRGCVTTLYLTAVYDRLCQTIWSLIEAYWNQFFADMVLETYLTQIASIELPNWCRHRWQTSRSLACETVSWSVPRLPKGAGHEDGTEQRTIVYHSCMHLLRAHGVTLHRAEATVFPPVTGVIWKWGPPKLGTPGPHFHEYWLWGIWVVCCRFCCSMPSL